MSGLSKTKDEIRSLHQMIQGRCFHPSNAFIEFRKEAIEQSIPARFEQQVRKYPDQIAIKTGNNELTYGALNRAANRVARVIGDQCGNAEEPIALLLGNGISMITSILAVLKTGKIFVPIDPQYPISRIAHMLADSQAGLIVTNTQYLALACDLAQYKYLLINIDENLTNHSTKNLDKSISPESIAYIVYTSGSTGKSKGIVHNHRNLLHTTLNFTNAYHICQEDRLTLLHSCSFSAGIADIFASLLNGATLYPWDIREEGLTGLPQWLMQEQITFYHWIPTPFHHFTDTLTGKEQFPHLRLLILGSETVSKQDIELYKKHFSPNAIFVNRLGTSETTTFRHYFIDRQTQINEVVPVGYAVDDKEVVLLDENKNKVGFNSVGEITVRSQFIALGYWRKPELTRAAFLPDPDGNRKRIYLTGDLGRMRPDGCLEHLGRKDSQVKIRGHRVETGEIEIALQGLDIIKWVVVDAREDNHGEKRLIAYVVQNQEQKLTLDTLRNFLKEKLPTHMIPATLVILDSLPLTPTGKVDRQALPTPEQTRSQPKETFVVPRTLTEEVLANIWAEVLMVDQVSIDDSFFELGGDSILSFQIVARANQAGIQITPRQLLEYPTIQTLSAKAGTVSVARADQGLVTGTLPLTPIMHSFLEQNIPNPHYYNQAVMLEGRQDVNPSLLAKVFQHLQTQHDILRLRFVQSESGYQPFIDMPEESIPFVQVDCSATADTINDRSAKGVFMQNMVRSELNLSESLQDRRIDIVSAQLQGSLNLSAGPLMRIAFFDFGPNRSGRLLICIHHFAVDGVSWRIMLEDLQTAYEQLHLGKSIQLPHKTASFKQWAEGLLEYAQSGALQEELSYWLAEPRKYVSNLPVDFPAAKDANTVDSSRVLSRTLTVEETRILLQEVPKFYLTQMNDVLLTVLVQAFAPWTGVRSLLVDLEGHGREDIGVTVDLTRTMGWFTILFPVLLDLGTTSTTGEALGLIKEQLRRIPNRGIGYGLLRFLSADTKISERLRKLPEAEVRFNYLGQFDQALSDSSFFKLTRESCGPARDQQGMRRYLIDIFSSVVEGHLQIDWTFSENVHRLATIEDLAERFIKELRYLIAHCQSLEAIQYTPSDFPLAKLHQRQLDKLISRLNKV